MKTYGRPKQSCSRKQNNWEYQLPCIAYTLGNLRSGCTSDQVELVHLTAIHSFEGCLKGMVNVAWGSIRSLTKGDHSPSRDSTGGRAVGAGKFAKVIVKGTVFFDDIDDMLNLTQTP